MRSSLKRILAAAAAGFTASVMLVTPAFAIVPNFTRWGAVGDIKLYNDAHTIFIGYVQVYRSNGVLYLESCDTYDGDGRGVGGRVDEGDGTPIVEAWSPGANTCSSPVRLSSFRKFRLVWGDYSTGWYAP